MVSNLLWHSTSLGICSLAAAPLENYAPYLAIYVLKRNTLIDQRVLITCVNGEAKPG